MYGGMRADGLGLTNAVPAHHLVTDDSTATKLVVGSINFPSAVPDPNRKVISFDEMVKMIKADLPSIPKKLPETASTPSLNPKQGVGSQKLPLHLVSPLATSYMAVGLANGAGKYGAGNFKGTEVLLSIYLAATLRHLFAFMEGEEFDPVDGTPHLGAVMANMAIIVDARAVGTLVDDRIIAGGYLKEIEALTEIYQGLLELHKDRNPFHFTRNNTDG